MASLAVINLMAICKREKAMIDQFRIPVSTGEAVARGTVLTKTIFIVIRFGGVVIVGPVAINTFHASRAESDIGFTLVAGVTVDGCVHTKKRERSFFMKLGDIFNNPGCGCVATGAICTDGHLMHIGVTGNTV